MTNPCIGCPTAWHADRNCNCAELCEKLKEYKMCEKLKEYKRECATQSR